MSHYGISNQKTTAGNFAAKAAYFEKKLRELKALQEKRIELGMSRDASNEALAADIAEVEAELAKVRGQLEGEHGTGPDDYYHKSGNDTLSSGICGPLGKTLGLGDHPKNGDYLALFRGINPRTNECFLGERRAKQIDKEIQKAEERKATPFASKKLTADDLVQLEKGTKEKEKSEPVLGFSSCISLQKSISVYWAQADDETRKVIQECLMGAVNDAIAHEHSAGRIRGKEGAQGAQSVEGECVTLIYLHCTARRVPGQDFPDPQLHVHLERPNYVRTKDGKYLTLHAGHLYKSQREFGAVVDISLYQRISKVRPDIAAAMVVDYTGHGLRLNESSVSKDVLVENSKRREQIQAEKQNLATSGQAAAQAIALRTRDGKDVDLGDGLDAYWRSTIASIRLVASTPEELMAPALSDLQRLVFRGETVIDEFAIDAAAASLTIGRGGIEDIEATKSEIFNQLGLVEIPQEADEEGRAPPKLYTTKELIGLEADCLKAVYAGLDDPRWAVGQREVDRVIDAYELEKQAKQRPGEQPFRLSQEQREAAYALTREGQFTFLKGAAGVGKSATLAPTFRLYAEVFKASGRRIIGVAPANKQSTELANSTGISAKTVHTLLIQHQEAMAAKQAGQRYKPKNIIGRGDIIVCDEAGMLDTYAMHALVVACHQSGARLICVGDRNQHGAVETAALFGLMHDAVGDRCAKIETIARQVDRYKPTAQALYEGKADLAIANMIRDDQVRVFVDGVNEADELVGDLFVDMKAGLPDKDGTVRELDWKDILVLADTNEQVRALNDKIRDARFARGDLSADGAVSIETEIRPGERFTIQVALGDRLLLRKTAKDAESEPIYNGDLGTVLNINRISRVIDGETVEDIQFAVARDDGKTVKINASEYQSLQYGYAMTGHKAQGMTVKQAYYLPAGHASLQSFYVAYTRGIHGAKTYLNSTAWPQFKKSVAQYVYKKNALDLMPQVRAAIRASVNSGVMAPLKEQANSVLDRLQGVFKKFKFPKLFGTKEKSAQTEAPKVEQKVKSIPATEADIEFSKAYGHAQYDMRKDGQTWPADATHVDVVVPENPPLGADAGDWKNPGSEVPADQRRDFCETLQGMTPALITTRYRFIKPTPQEATHERRLHSPADPRRGTQRTEPGRSAERGDRADLGTGESPGRVARGFGVYRLADGADRIQRDQAKHTQHRTGGFGELDPLAAGGGTPRDSLRQVPSRDLAAAGERRAEGVLPDHSDVRGRSAAELRRTGAGKPAAAAVKPVRFDKKADARAIQDAKRDVDLIKFAGDLGYKVDEEKTKTKYKRDQIRSNEAAVMTSGASQIDVFKGANGEWAWYDRKAGQGGDVFKLYQHEKPNATFAEAKQAVLDGQPQLSDRDREERDRRADLEAKEKQEKRAEAVRTGTAKAVKDLGFMGRRDTRYLESRGISKEVLAETRWKTDPLGRACFPHINADRNICGYEYRGSNSLERAKGFTTDTEKGIYIANGRCANPSEIRFCEAGVDTLSAYQLATPEERQRILFIGTTGEPGPNTEASIKALVERNKIQKFSLAYDLDKGGDSHTAKREQRLREAFPGAQIRDVREELGMQRGEDANELLCRLQAERTQQQEQPRSAADNRTQSTQPTREADQGKPSIQDDLAQQAEPEQTHDHHQDRGMSR